MNAKHTPGPWTLEKLEMPNDKIQFSILAKTKKDEFFTVVSDLDASDGDARLISAAPELLAALKKLVDYYRNGESKDGETAGHINYSLKLIAKAEGVTA